MAIGDPYITAADLADFLKMTTTDNDGFLAAAVLAASRWVDGYCRRQFNLDGSASARRFDVGHTGTVLTDDIGNATLAVATDTVGDGTYATAWTTADLQALPLDVIVKGRPITELAAVGSLAFPVPKVRRGLVRVTAKWGWPAVPDVVAQATSIQAARVYKRRESAEGVLGFGDLGVIRIGARVDPDVEELLADVRLAPGSF